MMLQLLPLPASMSANVELKKAKKDVKDHEKVGNNDGIVKEKEGKKRAVNDGNFAKEKKTKETMRKAENCQVNENKSEGIFEEELAELEKARKIIAHDELAEFGRVFSKAANPGTIPCNYRPHSVL
ncbi:hypothetical protein PFISCL1PPCAC_3906, partial [Pristionchus fissidentatus]